jgi:hypothetical protein
MTDYELLELAAKAAGMSCQQWSFVIDDCGWNPLIDDGDAFKLAVTLGIVPQSNASDDYDKLYAAAYVYDDLGMEIASAREPYLDDPYAATRRAIVYVAAELGRK